MSSPEPPGTSLLVADDHPLYRSALRRAVGDVLPDVIVRKADSLPAVLASLAAHPDTDLVLLDLHMPGNAGLAGLAALRSLHPATGVIIVSATDDPLVVRRALDHGAVGYLPKRCDIDVLGTAIRSVLAGQVWLPPGLRPARRDEAAAGGDRALARALAHLTPQQFKVLELTAEGLLNKQIADRLAIQERTVKAHLTAIFEKLHVRNRTQACTLFRQLLVREPEYEDACD